MYDNRPIEKFLPQSIYSNEVEHKPVRNEGKLMVKEEWKSLFRRIVF